MTDLQSAISGSGIRENAKLWLAALAVAVCFTMLAWAQKSPFDAPILLKGTDDMLRMVNVRDLLAGQNWFDLMQMRLGVEPGTLMHWSRLIDVPIAALVMLGNAFSEGAGERFAAIVWPFLTFVAAIAGLLAGVRRASGSSNMLPAFIIGGFALTGSGVFESGVIDHHNVQLALTIWLIVTLLPGTAAKPGFCRCWRHHEPDAGNRHGIAANRHCRRRRNHVSIDFGGRRARRTGAALRTGAGAVDCGAVFCPRRTAVPQFKILRCLVLVSFGLRWRWRPFALWRASPFGSKQNAGAACLGAIARRVWRGRIGDAVFFQIACAPRARQSTRSCVISGLTRSLKPKASFKLPKLIRGCCLTCMWCQHSPAQH